MSGCVPPDRGVTVSAAAFVDGLMTAIVELTAVVVTSASPAIGLVPVALP